MTMSDVSEDLMYLLSGMRDEQRAAAMSLAPLTVVSAGAGTGKTHTLASRFAWMLASDPTCKVDSILTLTFTKKAADEMRERIYKTLVEWRKDNERLSHLDDAIRRIDEAYISTIHSFAIRVIKEIGLTLDIDPSSSIVSEPEKKEFWRSFAWDIETGAYDRITALLSPWAREVANDLIGDESLARMIAHFGADTIASTADSACDLFGSMNMMPEDLLRFDIDDIVKLRDRVKEDLASNSLAEARAWCDELLPELINMKCGDKTKKMLQELYGTWGGGIADDDDCLRFIRDAAGEGLSNARFSNDMKELVVDVLGCELKDWKDHKKKYILPLIDTLYRDPSISSDEERAWRMLTRLAAVGWDMWENAKRARGVITYSDVVRHASRALLGEPSYAERFRHIVVDEFQDTDGSQDALIRTLASSVPKNGITSRTLFIVGDIKQSIYSFRMADPSLFADYIARSSSATDGSSVFIPLSRSYRMSGTMIRDINTVFNWIWRDEVTKTDDGVSIRYDRLEAPDDAAGWDIRKSGAADAPLELIIHSDNEYLKDEANEKGHIGIEKRRELLALAAAVRLSEIKESVAGIWDKRAKSYRQAKWSDMAVLVRTKASYSAFEQAFDKLGIPAVFAQSKAYFSRGEVRDMTELLRAASGAFGDHPLAGWIESPFSYVPPGALSKIAAYRMEHGITLEEAYRALYKDSCERFDRLRMIARIVSPSAAVLELLSDARWLGAYRPSTRDHVVANIRHGIDLLREYEAALGCSLIAESAYLASSMESGTDIVEPDVSTNDDAVTVMTMHSSKGLEFPIVVAAGLSEKHGSTNKHPKLTDRHIGASIRSHPIFDGAWGRSGDGTISKWCNYMNGVPEEEERSRLLYVAMTRAADHLICLGDITENINGTWIEAILQSGEEGDRRFPISEAGEVALRAKETARVYKADAEAEEDAPLPASIVVPDRATASSYAMMRWCPAAYRARYRQGLALKWELPDGDGYGGADMGSLVHWVMRQWDLDPAALSNILPDEDDRANFTYRSRTIPQFLRDVFSDASKRSVIKDWLTEFSKTDICDELRKIDLRGELMREVSFSVPFKNTKLIGSIDLMWKNEDGIHIRDWKITREKNAPRELYDEQLRFYAMAAHIRYPDAPIDIGIIHLRPGDASSDPIEIDDWELLGDDIERAAITAASGPFVQHTERCSRCPFFGNMLQSCKTQ